MANDSFSDKMDNLGAKLKSKAKIFDSSHLRMMKEQVRTTFNPNHRHDEEHEKAVDRERQRIRDQHRFNSFAPETHKNVVRFHVDGHDYFWALSIMIEEAKETIMILDWWLSPELYLRRPPALYQGYRLDRLLLKKAQEGVKIYIQVYKEVTQSLALSSSHTKHALQDLHENITVLRHPDHLGGDVTLYWSHHEKLCIVDSTTVAMGGLDACFGRWDTHSHPLADVHPTRFDHTLFPGQDYNNARVMDFQNVDRYASNEVDRTETARMPWHDTSLTFMGPAVVDLAQHWIERWNFIKHQKYKHDDRYEWLALPQPFDAPIDQEDPADRVRRDERRREHPHVSDWVDSGRAFFHPYHSHPSTAPKADVEVPVGTCCVQVVRSAGDWSHGILVEDSIQRAYAQMILESSHGIYMENQFFITTTVEGSGPVLNTIGRALVDRILSAARSGRKWKAIIIIPEIPAFPGRLDMEGGLKAIMGAQFRSMNRGGDSIMEQIAKEGFDPSDYIRWYALRSYDRINAPRSFIKQMEERSGINFHEAQVAEAKLQVGSDNVGHVNEDVVVIKKPASGVEGEVKQVEEKSGGQQVASVPMPKTVEEARSIIDRFEKSATRPDEEVSDNVGDHALANPDSLASERWLGTDEEEIEAYVTELCYIHSKLLIVDDRRVICGSANLNDRSMCGDRDSEIAIVIEDRDLVETQMDGKPYMAGRLAKSWRHQLMKEHLGLIAPQLPDPEHKEYPTPEMKPAPHEHTNFLDSEQDQLVSDFLSDEFLNLWSSTAKKNREIFAEVFKTTPHDSIKTWKDYNAYIPNGITTGHVADRSLSPEQLKQKLDGIRGHLVEMPLQFLIDEHTLERFSDLASVNAVTLPLYL